MSSKSSFYKNSGILIFTQMLIIGVPFLYYPYLINSFSASSYGEVLYAQIIISLFSVVIDFGFFLTGTKSISENIENKTTRCEVFSTIISLKVAIFSLLALLILSLWLYLPYTPYVNYIAILIIFLMGDSISPNWLYNAYEKNYYFSLATLFQKMLVLSYVLLFIDNNSSISSFVFFISNAHFISNAIMLFVFVRKFDFRFVKPTKASIILEVKSAFNIFLSKLSTILFLKGNGIVVGHFLGFRDVAIYNFSERIISIFLMPINMINQALFPRVAKDKDYVFVYKVIGLLLLISLLGYPIVVSYLPMLINFYVGPELKEAADVIIGMYMLVPISIVSFFLGNCILINKNLKKQFSMSIHIGAITYFVGIGILLCFSITIESLVFCLIISSLTTLTIRLLSTVRCR
ncbi:Membrane protein involved in the export of O-antigen, teichoic acid lipoteichoic acids [Vibrio chagasii]|nr:Membrane protein involved in the export of O-antigen, teichoic acid lipoteichoic acids [Vibrio chagasii]